MIEAKVIELIHQVEPLGNFPITITPATEEALDAFELAHDLTLPAEVRAWLRLCNGACVNPGGLYGLFSKEDDVCSIDWYLKEYPEWKSKGWIPIADDGCGDLYILASAIVIPFTGTHPVFFLDQADFSKPDYVVGSGLWKFLFFLLENEILAQQGKDTYWPFEERKVIACDPEILECRQIPLPWEADSNHQFDNVNGSV